VAVWVVICANCSSNIVHSTVEQNHLADWLIPLKPEVPTGARIVCEKCQTSVSFLRSDLRYLAND
jgi:hypothetical protein